MNELKRTLQWFELAVPNPTDKNKQVQRGCHFEEVAEELENLIVVESASRGCAVRDAKTAMKSLADSMKTGRVVVAPSSSVEDLDALVDQIVTSVGKAHMLGYDVMGALKEVNDSNFSKFVEGKPVFDENGKIKKGKDYFQPNLDNMV